MNDCTTEFQAFRQRRYFGSLDGLRCLSIVPVVWHHSAPRQLDGLLGKGPFGLQLFFVISGFLITTLLLRERDATQHLALGRFYARRALRILPLYYAVLASHWLYSLYVAPEGPQRTHFLESVVYYATFTSNWFVNWSVGHPISFAFAWTLAAEEQFYCTWPWGLRWLRGTWLPLGLLCLVLFVSEWVRAGRDAGWGDAGSLLGVIVRSVPSAICLGAALGLVMHHPVGYRVVNRAIGGRWGAVIALLLVACLLAIDATPPLVFHLGLILLVAACCVREDHWLKYGLSWRPVAFVGQVSYGIYLLNAAVIAAVRRLVDQERYVLVFGLALPLSIALAALSYAYLEQPLLKLRHRFSVKTASP